MFALCVIVFVEKCFYSHIHIHCIQKSANNYHCSILGSQIFMNIITCIIFTDIYAY